MKKSFFLISIVLFSFLVSPAYAQEATDEAQLSPRPAYMLPYPGVLPDSPFYFLKVTRDRVISFLISDSLKKAEFDLLQAEKRLASGRYLVDKKNFALAESTFSKGLNYLEQAITSISDAQKEGRDIKPFHEKLVLSIEEHRNIYTDLESRASGDFKSQMNVLFKRIETYEKSVDKLLPKN